MTQAALRKLYFDMNEVQRKMQSLGGELKELKDYDSKWVIKGSHMIGASWMLSSWMEALDKLIENRDD